MKRQFVIPGAVVLLLLGLIPLSRAAGADAARSFKYEDDRLGERKDQSDKFKFVRVLNSPMYAGAFLGDRGLPWSHDYPEAGIHFSKILSELSKLDVVVDEDEFIFSF